METTKGTRHVINHPGELETLSVLPIKRTLGQRRVALAEHLIASPDRERLEGELNRRLFACGCPAAAAGVLLGVAAYAVWAAFAPGDISLLGHIGRALAAALVGALAGKLAGLSAAEKRLKEIVSEIRRAVPQSGIIDPKPLPERYVCY